MVADLWNRAVLGFQVAEWKGVETRVPLRGKCVEKMSLVKGKVASGSGKVEHPISLQAMAFGGIIQEIPSFKKCRQRCWEVHFCSTGFTGLPGDSSRDPWP
jgi:hypothetical protein